MSKYFGIIGLVLAVLAMASGTGFAVPASITFDECTVAAQNPCLGFTDGLPHVTITGFSGEVIVSPTPEGATVTADLINITAIPTGTRFAVLFEGAGSQVISDVVTLTAAPQANIAGTLIQEITVAFASDVEGTPLLCSGCPGVAEDGTFQDLSGPTLLNSLNGDQTTATALFISVRSDPPEAVPEPSTLLLLGSGLAGLGLWRRRHS